MRTHLPFIASTTLVAFISFTLSYGATALVMSVFTLLSPQ